MIISLVHLINIKSLNGNALRLFMLMMNGHDFSQALSTLVLTDRHVFRTNHKYINPCRQCRSAIDGKSDDASIFIVVCMVSSD